MSPKITEGEVAFNCVAAGKPCKTFYKVIGDLQSGKCPLVALHGGPGVNHAYLIILGQLTEAHGIPVVVYDQIGNGQSTHLPEKMGDESFFTDKLFIDELDNLLSHLGIKNRYDLYGHSWGGMMAARHATTQPTGLRRLILASTPAEMKLWVSTQNQLLKRLPQAVQDTIHKHEQEGTTQDKEYQEAVGQFYGRFLCKIEPMPQPIAEGFECIGKDPTVYLTMNGPSEFTVTGPLKSWTVTEDIPKIIASTLLINGKDDEAQDPVMMPFFKYLSKVKWVQFANSSHMVHHEETERFMEVVGQFLTVD